MSLTGPDVVQAVTGEEITHNGLGVADVHAGGSGVAGFSCDDESECLKDVRYLLSLLPQNNRELPPAVHSTDPVDRRTDALTSLVLADPAQVYDVRAVIGEIVDDGEFSRRRPPASG